MRRNFAGHLRRGQAKFQSEKISIAIDFRIKTERQTIPLAQFHDPVEPNRLLVVTAGRDRISDQLRGIYFAAGRQIIQFKNGRAENIIINKEPKSIDDIEW